MRAQLLTISLIVGTIASTAAAQRSVRYEFHMSLVSNAVTGTDHVGVLNGMPIGTPALLTIDANDVVVAADLPSVANYQVTDVSFSAGPLVAGAAPGFYPSTNEIGSVGIGNEAALAAGALADYFVATMFFDHSEIDSFATLVLTDEDVVNGERLLFDSAELPEAMDINLVDAERRIFQVSSSQNSRFVTFEINLIQAIVVPAPPAAAALGLGLAAVARRRR